MSKKLLELARTRLSGRLLTDFEDFYAFLKSESMAFSQSYKCYRFKYKGVDIGKVSLRYDAVGCRVSLAYKGNSDKYVEGQAEELADIFMKSLEHKCINCREGRTGCSKQLGMTIRLRN